MISHDARLKGRDTNREQQHQTGRVISYRKSCSECASMTHIEYDVEPEDAVISPVMRVINAEVSGLGYACQPNISTPSEVYSQIDHHWRTDKTRKGRQRESPRTHQPVASRVRHIVDKSIPAEVRSVPVRSPGIVLEHCEQQDQEDPPKDNGTVLT